MVKTTGVTQPTDKVRLGRLTECDQPQNSIVLNASNAKIDNIEHSGFYVSPIRCTQASNLLAYNSTTKEIVDIGGQKLKISSLEVENLDVVNSNTVHNYYVDNPIFEIAKGNPRALGDVGIVMHRAGGNVDIKFSEKNNHLAINKDLAVDGIVKAKIFEGDAGLLSNVQFNFEVGDTFENLTITKELHADGGLLSNISIQQLKDLKNASLELDNIYMDGTLRSKKAIYSQTSVIAPIFKGDGSELTGVALKRDLESNVVRIEKVEGVVPKVYLLESGIESIKTKLPEIDILERRLSTVENEALTLKPVCARIDNVEKYTPKISENTLRIQNIETEIKKIKPTIPDVSQIRTDLEYVKAEVPKISVVEQSVKTFSELPSQLRTIEFGVNRLTNEVNLLKPHEPRIRAIEKTMARMDAFETFKKSTNEINTNISRKINGIERNLNTHVEDFKTNLLRLNPLEAIVSNVHTAEEDISVIEKTLPKLDERIQALEDYIPTPPTLQSVTSCESNTNCTVLFENAGVSLSTVGNIGVGTTTPTSRLSIYQSPDIVSILGEVDAIKINELAQINAYTKANAGLSSGRPGGLVFKTKRPNGGLEDSMTIDGNGSVTVGNSVANTCAALSINSTQRGLLLPRMTTEQISAIKNPEPGLMVYDTEKDAFVGYKKTGWVELF